MDNIINTRPHQIEASLAELAAQINAEHGLAETAIREGLSHARQAGMRLLQGKARIPHGNWLPWLKANCRQGNPRTAQRYMRLAEHWEEVVTRGGETLRGSNKTS
jgi:hypothetical protein